MSGPRAREHEVSISVNGREIGGWLEYSIETSLIEPADSFSLSRPFSFDAWQLCRRDAYVRVLIDGQPRASGFVDTRRKSAAAGTMEITGRDRVGRLVQESAPRSAYGGTTTLAVLEALAAPWFQKVTLSNARNRKVLLGKGSRVPADGEAVALIKGRRSTGKAKDPIAALFAKPSKGNRIDPGQARMAVITQVASQMGLAVWASADGKELFVGKPNQTQAATFLFRHAARGQSTVVDLDYVESNADRYSMITAVGAGSSGSNDFGETACTKSGTVWDNPENKIDGTGRDFLYPKRLVLSESALRDRAEAERNALRDQQRRDFARTSAIATCWYHGQVVSGSTRTLFALDTMARVIDDEIRMDEDFLIYAASFTASRQSGETTTLHMVPRGTELVV